METDMIVVCCGSACGDCARCKLTRLKAINIRLVAALQTAYGKLHNFVVIHGDDVMGEAWETAEPRIKAVLEEAREK
jgi:hypothetical protein